MLVYTGQLSVAATGDQRLEGKVTLVAGESEKVVAQGRSPAPEATFALTADGTYAYFGSLTPVETDAAIGVIDEALPAWLRARVSADIPRMLGLFAEKLGPLGGAKPSVYLSFTALSKRGSASFGGGTLDPNVVNLDLELGPDVLVETNRTTRIKIDKLAAHEAAHFWNAGKYAPDSDPASAWMHEGTADAMAFRALRVAGTLDEPAYREELSRAAAECALWLTSGDGVRSATRRGHSRALYVCGSTINLAIESACHAHDATCDLFSFWRSVFEQGKTGYDERLVLDMVTHLTGGDGLEAAIHSLLYDAQPDPTTSVRELLRRAHVRTSAPQGPYPAAIDQMGAVPLVSALLTSACIEALAFDSDTEVRPRVRADGACAGLERGDVVGQVEGVSVAAHGVSAFARGYSACVKSQALDVTTTTGKHARLTCVPKPHAAPTYFRVDTP